MRITTYGGYIRIDRRFDTPQEFYRALDSDHPPEITFDCEDADLDYAFLVVHRLVEITIKNARNVELSRLLSAPHMTWIFSNCVFSDRKAVLFDDKTISFDNCTLTPHTVHCLIRPRVYVLNMSLEPFLFWRYELLDVHTDEDLSVLRTIDTEWLFIESTSWIGLRDVVDLPNIRNVQCTVENVDETQATTIARELKDRGANVRLRAFGVLRGRTREIIIKAMIESNVQTAEPEVLRERELNRAREAMLATYGFRKADPTKPAPIGGFNDKTGDGAVQDRIARMLIGRVRKR